MKSVTSFNTKLTLSLAAMGLLLSMSFINFVHANTTSESETDTQTLKTEAVSTVMQESKDRIRNADVDGILQRLREQISSLQQLVRGSTPVSSDTESLSEKVRSLLQEVTALRQSIGTASVETPVVTTPPTSVGMPAWCSTDWNRSLRVGDQGEDVKKLQQFLNSNTATRIAASGFGAPGNETTYFGEKTAAALARWQEQNREGVLTPAGLSSGSGYFGEISQRWMKRLCDDTDQVVVRADMSVSPKTGVAPLSVDFTANKLKADQDYIIEFGDGENSGKLTASSEGVIETTHEYVSAGSYRGTLQSYAACMWEGEVRCMMAAIPLATVIVKVSNDGADDTNSSYSIGDIASVSSEYVDPIANAIDDEYTQYTIELEDGTTHVVKVNGMLLEETIAQQFADTGFDGDYQDIIDMATEVEPAAVTLDVTVEDMTAIASFQLANGCQGYTLDWGDDSSDELIGNTSLSATCTQAIRDIELAHEYSDTGEYKVKLTITGSGSSKETVSETIEIQ